MSLWDRLKQRWLGGATEAEAPVVEEEAAQPEAVDAPRATAQAPVEELRDKLAPIDEAESRAELLRARGTPRESEVLAGLLEREPELPEGLRVLAAELLALRGEDARARSVLARATSAQGLMLAADLHANAGDYPRALGAIERVLARDIQTPGALERHAEWARIVGAVHVSVRRRDEATTIAAAPDSTSFRILAEVARGGAGTVYEAVDDDLMRRVAFKIYHHEGKDAPAVLREVRLAALLAGPGIVKVYDASPEAGWVALEWAPYGSLKQCLEADRRDVVLPVRSWALPLAQALARVHALGLVHSDVKPANILLRRRGEPILTDFGIARTAGQASEGGSVGYLSPERIGGQPASFADDVYGFGRVLEDALARADAAEREALGPLVGRCLGELDGRPPSGDKLVQWLASTPRT